MPFPGRATSGLAATHRKTPPTRHNECCARDSPWAYEKHWRTNTVWGASPERDRRARPANGACRQLSISLRQGAARRWRESDPRGRARAVPHSCKQCFWQWLL